MAQTVIGIFESSSKAQAAVQELVEAGITRDRIDVSGGNTSGSSYASDSSYSSTGTTGTSGDSDEHESGISKFFKNLFGSDDDNDDADKYSRVASQAQSIVTVHAESRDEAERVADILDDNGAVDVDEHATKMGYTGKSSYSGTGSGVTGSSGDSYSGTGLTGTDLGAGVAGTGTGVTGMGADVAGAGLGTGIGGSTVGASDYTATDRTGLGNTGGADYTDMTTTTGTTGYTGSDRGSNVTNDETGKIQIIEENLQVGKREVNTGGVRLRSRIIERPVEESLRLREERVTVERNSVDRPATAADLANFQEKDIELVERAEVPVVNKEARVVEEVSLAKEVEERTETIQDTVRKTEVDVENLGDNDLTRNNRTGNNDLTGNSDLTGNKRTGNNDF
jgi:uncharacterized protein (TIGR02271 family)